MLHPALVPLAAVLSSAAPGEAAEASVGATPAALSAAAAVAPLRDAAVLKRSEPESYRLRRRLRPCR